MAGRITSILLAGLISLWPTQAFSSGDFTLEDHPGRVSHIDWQLGYVYAYGTAPYPQNSSTLTDGFKVALNAAWRDAISNLYGVSFNLYFDSSLRVGDLIKQGEARRKAHRRFLNQAYAIRIFLRSDGTASTWVEAPLYGPDGLANIDRPEKKGGKYKSGSGGALEGNQGLPFIRIELTEGKELEPCLWPSIFGPDGKEIFNTAQMNRDRLIPEDFKVYWIFEKEPEGTDNFTSAYPSWGAEIHQNKPDLILTVKPEGLEELDLSGFGGIIIRIGGR